MQSRATDALSFGSPVTGLAGCRINASGHVAVFSQSGPDAHNGLSLAWNGCTSQRLHSGVKVPGLLFRDLPNISSARSVLLLRYRSRFAPVLAASMPQTRCGFRVWFDQPPCPISTPLQEFYLPLDQSVQLDQLSVNPPSEFARSSFAPRSQFFSVQAAAHRSRFATFPEACCSSNLLEPPSLCS
jgi:hypothetical protein